MTAHSPERAADRDARHDQRPTDRWVTLQRSVATAMIAAFAFTMALVARAFVPPLAIFALVFGVPLALTAWRHRGPAIAIGVLSVVWLALQVANASMVVPDLVDPAAGASFVATSALIVVPVVGVVGLVGLLRGSAQAAATRTLQAAAVVMAVVAATGVVAAALVGEQPVAVSDGPATVTLRDIEFQPANLQVPAGSTVTWQWADGQVEHDVVADGFASDLKAEGDFAHTFDTPGTYAYRCSVHPGMTGTVTVVADDAAQDGAG